MLNSVGLSYVYVWVLGRTSEADKLHPTLLLLVTPFRGVRSGTNTFLIMKKVSYLIIWVLACYGLMSCDKDDSSISGGKLEGTVWESKSDDLGLTLNFTGKTILITIDFYDMDYSTDVECLYTYEHPYVYTTSGLGTFEQKNGDLVRMSDGVYPEHKVFKRKK